MLLDEIMEPIEMYIGISDLVSYVLSSEPKTINVYDFTIEGQKEKLKSLKDELFGYWVEFLVENNKGVTYTGVNEVRIQDIAQINSNYFHTLLKSRKAIMDEYPIFNNTGRMEKFYNDLKGGLQSGCNNIIKAGAESNIPNLSIYCKGLEGDTTTDWNITKLYGSFQKGALGAMGGMVDSTVEMFIDPLTTASGIWDILAMDREDVIKVKDEALEYLDKKVINGAAEERSEFAGAAFANIAMMILMFKGAKKPKTPALLAEESGVEINVAKEAGVKGTAKMADDVVEASSKAIEGTSRTKITVNYGEQYGKIGNKKVLKPNIEYTDGNGYKYATDDIGRITNAKGELNLGEGTRNPYAQRTVGETNRLPTDDGGHLIGNQFNGSGQIDNLVPQNSGINRSGGEWYKMEQNWASALKDGSSVKVDITPNYSGNSVRPDNFKVNYWIDGEKFTKIIKNP